MDSVGGNGGTVAGQIPCDRTRILVVDDEPSIVKLFKMLLEFDLPGKSIETASNGQEAVERFMAAHHRILVMDLHMPVLDGLNAFKSIETACREKSWEMPSVVFCTGYAPADPVLKAVSASTTHCLLQKPVTCDVLIKAVSSRLS
jgi:CheY-like chemotaxis protein